MSEDNNNSNNDLSREELNEQLDELRKKQQERKAKKKPRSRWKRLLGFLGLISGLFLLGTSCSKPTVTCYRRAEESAEEAETSDEVEEDGSKPINEYDREKINKLLDKLKMDKEEFDNDKSDFMCYCRIDNNEDEEKNSYTSPLKGNTPIDSKADAAIEELEQYYEKVKQESSVNKVDNADNAETNDKPTE